MRVKGLGLLGFLVFRIQGLGLRLKGLVRV